MSYIGQLELSWKSGESVGYVTEHYDRSCYFQTCHFVSSGLVVIGDGSLVKTWC